MVSGYRCHGNRTWTSRATNVGDGVGAAAEMRDTFLAVVLSGVDPFDGEGVAAGLGGGLEGYAAGAEVAGGFGVGPFEGDYFIRFARRFFNVGWVLGGLGGVLREGSVFGSFFKKERACCCFLGLSFVAR